MPYFKQDFFEKIFSKKVLIAVVLLVLASIYSVLLSKSFYVDSVGAMHSTYVGYGDIPFHLSQYNFFNTHSLVDAEETIFKGAKMQYSFAVNYLSSLLFRLTGLNVFSFLFPVIIFSIGNILLLYFVLKKIGKNSFLAILGIPMFFLASGYDLYNHSISSIISYGPPMIIFFIHQRAFIPGLFFFLLIFASLIKYQEKPELKYLFIIGISYGILPIFHIHSFISVSVLLFVWLIYLLIKKDWSSIKGIAIAVGLGSILAAPQLYYLVINKTLGKVGSFLHFRFGWMVGDSGSGLKFLSDTNFFVKIQHYAYFLWKNFGLILPSFVLAGTFLIKAFRDRLIFNTNKNSNERVNDAGRFYTPTNLDLLLICFFAGLLLYIVVNLVQLQPWDFDNNKLLVYFQLFWIPLVLYLFNILIKTKRWILSSIVIVIFVIISCGGGIIEIGGLLFQKYQNLPVIFSRDAVDMSEYVNNNVGMDDFILTSTVHINPVLSLSGRPVLVGYPGWLWTRGINYSERENEIKRFYNDPEKNMDVVAKYDVKYVLFDNSVIKDYGAKREVFEKIFKIAYEGGDGYVLFTLAK